MATTNAWLTTKNHGRLCFVLAFEGYDLAYTTHSTPSELATAWAATDWTSFKSGLHIVGEMGQEISLFDPKISPDNLTFILTDHDDTLIGRLLREADDTMNKTYQTASIDADDNTAITVKSTTGFAASGHVYIGHEAIHYDSVTATTFAAVTRGKWVLWGTSTSSTRYGVGHPIDPSKTADIGNAPAVSSLPRIWYNRRVGLYAHHLEDTVAGTTWSTKANAQLIWAGRIKSYAEDGAGKVSISCTGIQELLYGSILQDQYQAFLNDGIYLADADIAVRLTKSSAAITAYDVNTTLTSSLALTRTWQEVRDELNQIFNSWFTAGSIAETWEVKAYQNNTDIPQTRILFAASGAATFSRLTIDLSPRVWFLLGVSKDDDLPGSPDANNRVLHEKVLQRAGLKHWLTAVHRPVVSDGRVGPGASMAAGDVSGTWITQTTMPTNAPTAANGWLLINGEDLWIVQYSSDTFTFYDRLGSQELPVYGIGDKAVREGQEGTDRVPIKQVWLEDAGAGTILTRFLLSTGASTYNDATYDVHPIGMGLAIPYELINQPSFRSALDADVPDYRFYIDKPTPVSEIVETLCAITNRYVIWDSGTLRLIQANTEVPNLASARTLTEDNKAKPDDRISCERTPDGLINRMVLSYAQAYPAKEFRKIETVEDVVSIHDFGQRRAIEIKAGGLKSPSGWIHNTAAPALANFSRPWCVFERTYDFSLYDLVPGDPALLTDNALVHPRLGTRGVTEMPCWILGTSFDWRSGIGKVKAVFSPEKDFRKVGLWGPSAKITGYVTGTKTITCTANAYSHSSESADATNFIAGDKVRIVEISPATAASPETYVATVDSQSGNDIVLTTDPTAGAGLGAGKTFVIEYDDIVTASGNSGQLEKTFIADDADNSTGNATNDVYRWDRDMSADSLSLGSLDYTVNHVRHYSIQDDVGEPLSIHKIWTLVDTANNSLGYKTSNIYLQDWLPSEISTTSTTYVLVYGPILVPIYGHISRTLKVLIYGHNNTNNVRTSYNVISSPSSVRGISTATADLKYSSIKNNVVAFITGDGTATRQWAASEFTLTPAVQGLRPPKTFITIEMKVDSASTGILRGVVIRENTL